MDDNQQQQPKDDVAQQQPVIPSLDADIEEPENPVSGPNREFGPPRAPIEAPVEDFVQLGEPTPDIPQEVQEAGVEAVPSTEHPQIHPDVQEATGITPVQTAVQVPQAPSGIVQLPNMPMDEATAVQTIKEAKPSESRRWLAILTQFLLAKAKRLHGQLQS